MRRLLSLFTLIASCLTFAAPTQASKARLSPSTIITLEKKLREMPSLKSELAKCVRVYTIETRGGRAVGIGVIVLPGRGYGYPSDVKVPNVNPKLMKPGFYIVRPEQMPIWPLSYFATDVGMYSIRFDPKSGMLLDI